MVKRLAMFPGQGSQSVGMARELLQEFPKTKLVFEEVEDTTKIEVLKMCLEGPEDMLKLTQFQQPCILSVSIAKWQVLKEESGFTPEAFAGHSLGEYSALVAAEKLRLDHAARLVYERGRFMQRAVPEGTGAMAAVLKGDPTTLSSLCEDVSKDLGETVQVANFNRPSQQIVSGTAHAVKTLIDKLALLKVRAVMLPVSAPFHCSLMKSAAETMKNKIEETNFSEPKPSIISNVTAKDESDVNRIKPLLIDQITSRVRWRESVDYMIKQGVNDFLEIGPGKVLSGLVKKIDRGVKISNINSLEDIKND